MKKLILIPVLLFSLLFISGCSKPSFDSKSCSVDADCACGVHINTGECFVGNKDYVNTEKQCPDFCTGIAGNLETVCSNNKCQTINTAQTLNLAYCDSDADCVRKNSCCDCGLGDYINKKYQVEVSCQGPRCLCPIADSVGKCVNNRCAAVPSPGTEFCGGSTSGFCSSSDDCVKGGCSSQVCQSKNEESAITTCEYKECYNPDIYNLECKCIDSKCEWGAK